jgi:hypothetical protein
MKANANDALENVVEQLLRSVPETWAEFDLTASSASQEQALFLLTAAGMIERRVTLRLRMAGQPVTVEATITLTGETGLAQAMQFLLKDTWKDWREAFEKQLGSEPKDEPSFHCERVGNEQWRLTADGVLARSDLKKGNVTTVLDFVLRRGLFDGQPRMMPDGRIGQRPPVAGRGLLERMNRVKGDAAPTGMSITNWEDGAKVFAAAFAEINKAKLAASETTVPPAEHPSVAILRVFTNGIADERIAKASQVLADDKLTANDKLTKIDSLIAFPPTASAEQLGRMLGVSKQAVMKTEWWRKNRRGESQEEIDKRFEEHEKRRGTPIDRRRVERKELSSDDDDDE